MKANAEKLLKLLEVTKQFEIPIYQRLYSWTPEQCKRLWEDVMHVGGQDAEQIHFIGSIVYVKKEHDTQTKPTPSLVIDGQQRLATVTLLIAALASHVSEKQMIEGFSTLELRENYLQNRHGKDQRKYKLLMTETDRKTMFSIVDEGTLPENFSHRVKSNFELFQKNIKCLDEKELCKLCNGLDRLMVVDVALVYGKDDPQLIFDSLNSTGLDLSQTDRIRNFIFMRLSQDVQGIIYRDYWRPMEKLFGQENVGNIDDFMRHYLTAKTNNIPSQPKVYEAFIEYAKKPEFADDMQVLMQDVYKFSKYYCAMAFGGEKNQTLKSAFTSLLNDLGEATVTYPFLLRLYGYYADSKLSEIDFAKIIGLVENYVFRRSVCDIPTNSLNTTFARFFPGAEKFSILDFVNTRFKEFSDAKKHHGYQRFPDDEEFRLAMKGRDLYNFARKGYYLRKLEKHLQKDSKEKVSLDTFTIEHIMPVTLSPEWEKNLGENHAKTYERYLHTLANLTLTGYNSEYSNRAFADKQTINGGFNESPLKLNKGVKGKLTGLSDTDVNQWTEQEMETRADQLAKIAVAVWPFPL